MIGVLGDGPVAGAVREALCEAGVRVVAEDANAVASADPDLVVAVGEDAVVALVGAGVDAPVLPVDAGPGLRSVLADDAVAAVERAVAGEWTPEARDRLAVEVDGSEWTALLDVLLVTAEPVRISEYGLAHGDERAAVARFRADGVVVATPAGSPGYARAAGGSVVAPGTGTVSVVPVAPFTTDRRRWVLDPPVALTVEREATDVSIVVDGVERTSVPPGVPVSVRPGGTLTLATVPESRPFFDRPE